MARAVSATSRAFPDAQAGSTGVAGAATCTQGGLQGVEHGLHRPCGAAGPVRGGRRPGPAGRSSSSSSARTEPAQPTTADRLPTVVVENPVVQHAMKQRRPLRPAGWPAIAPGEGQHGVLDDIQRVFALPASQFRHASARAARPDAETHPARRVDSRWSAWLIGAGGPMLRSY
jgi:hypothetical protein